MKKIFLAHLLWCVLFGQQAFAETALDCNQLLDHATAHQLRILTLNTQGLHLRKNIKRDQHSQKNHNRYLGKVEAMADAIAEINPDITVLQEVSSEYELEYIINNFLGSRYNYHFIKGNDGHGNVAFLVKKNLKFEFEYRTNKDRLWNDPASGKTRELFSRDAPVLILKSDNKAIVAIIGHHAKAKRDRTGDPESTILRTQQNNEIVVIAQELVDEFGNIPVLAAGDFNANLHTANSTAELTQKMTDVFDLLARPPPQKRRITFSYFSHNEHVQNQLDAILALNPSELRVKRADVFRYRDPDGNEYRLPKNREERRKLMPSDHNPVWADILIPVQ